MLLVTGGSQGATGLNQLLVETLPLLAKSLPESVPPLAINCAPPEAETLAPLIVPPSESVCVPPAAPIIIADTLTELLIVTV